MRGNKTEYFPIYSRIHKFNSCNVIKLKSNEIRASRDVQTVLSRFFSKEGETIGFLSRLYVYFHSIYREGNDAARSSPPVGQFASLLTPSG